MAPSVSVVMGFDCNEIIKPVLKKKDPQSHTLFNGHPRLDHNRTCTSDTHVNRVYGRSDRFVFPYCVLKGLFCFY